MSIKVKYDQVLINLLKSVFYESPSDVDEFLPIVKDMKNIPNILSFLNTNKNSQKDLDNSISLVFFLKNLFSENNDLIPLFLERCVNNKESFLKSLADLYLNEQIDVQAQTLLGDLINNINYTASVQKDIFEHIYQKLSIFYNINQRPINESKKILTGKILIKHLKLLNIFYTDLKNENKPEENEKKSTNVEDKIIRNYFYFNGLNSGITISLNKNSTNLNIESPTLVEGLSLIVYVNLSKELLDDYFNSVLPSSNSKINLIKLLIGEHEICVELKDSENISIRVDKNESDKINISKDFKYDLWNSILFLIEPNSSRKKGELKIVVNEGEHISSLSLPKNFTMSEKIDNIILFENLIGKATSISFFSFLIEEKLLKFFNKTLYGGFYKNKLLLKFLNSIDKDFCKTIKNYREYEKIKKEKLPDKAYNISIGLKDFQKKRIMSIICPFMYNKNENIIDDAFGTFIGKLNSEYDGAYIYSNNIKNVIKLGGINNLLPIAELMLTSQRKNNYFIETNLLTEGTLIEYLKIIKVILNHHKESIVEINNDYFFSCLALFLEKFPPWVFTINILNIFLEIFVETYRYKGYKISDNPQLNIGNPSLNYRFINIIIFNEKIISKFTDENQHKMWEGIYNFFKKDNSKIKESLSIPKIINLLRFYDRNRYEKYCCKKHASLFGSKDENEIMKPEMNSRVGKLFDVIQLFVDNIELEKGQINLYEILSLDLSSCLKKKIIQIYIFHFINDKINDKTKEKTLINLLDNNYFEISEYALSVSLLDIRSEIFKLLHIFLLKYKDKINEYISKYSLKQNQVFSFISENILPVDVKINQISGEKSEDSTSGNYYKNSLYKNNILGKTEDKNLLAYYFDKKIYEDDINSIWGLLNSWMTENAPVQPVPQNPEPSSHILSKTMKIFKKEKEHTENVIKAEDKFNLLINPYILSFLIDFVSKVKPFFINSFLESMNSSLKGDETQNKDVAFHDRKFFPWLVDTIYFFHNKENESLINEKELLESIKKNSLELICEVFKIKTSLKDIENKIYYLIEYSSYFKKRFANYNNHLKEIIRITRLIFKQILKNSQNYFNIISIFCFEFIFLHKNSEEVLANFNCEFQRNSLLDTESLNKTLKKSKEDDVGSTGSGSKKKNIRGSVNYEDYDSNRLSSIDRGSVMNKTMSSDVGNLIPECLIANQIVELIPNYYHQGMYSIPQNANQNIEGIYIKKILKNIWYDYELFYIIINYYKNEVWGPETLFKTVKMKYNPEDNILDSCKTLLKNYEDEKEYKNILLKNINRLVIIDNDYQNGINKINLLYLNLILICFSIDISGVLSEQEELTELLIEFLIFCIMASININQTEDTYNYIQKKLYHTLSFGLLFLKDKDEAKYRELLFYLIEPFFEGLSSQSISIKKIFVSKKSLYKNTAIYKVFIKSDPDAYENRTTKLEDAKKKGSSSSIPKKKFSLLKRMASTKKKDDDKKDSNKIVLILRGYPAQVVKNIFGKVINFYKEEKYLFNLDNYITLFYFQKENIDNNKINNNSENIIEAEKKRINILMRKLIPNIFSEVNKTSISTYLEEKRRRNNFKKIKKALFSWNGFWSNKTLFFIHPEYLKYRIKNHFCKDMSKILLSPILDLNYYLPKFSKFDISNLFNKNNYKYNICTDVDTILNVNNSSDKNKIPEYIKHNDYNFNYLESLYKSQYNNIWDYYNSNYIEQKNDYNENKTLSSKEIFELLFQNKLSSINEENVQSENLYTCCIVKPTHHIKGYASTEKTGITFTYCPDNETKELLEKDPSYDKDMGACFGSTFKRYHKDKDIIYLEIKYKSIEFMFIKSYFYQETGLEIYTYEKKSYLLVFKTNLELLKFIGDILLHEKFRTIKCHGYKNKRLLGYCKLFNIYSKKKSLYPGYIAEEWQNNNISTFEYLMWLNIFAGRSFNDLTQYPVFPWIITNYQSEELNEKEDLRDLSIPVGMFDFNEKAEMRKETFIEFYNTLKNDLKESTPNFDYNEYLEKLDSYIEHFNNKKSKKDKDLESSQIAEESNPKIEINQLPYYYGSHYSNPTYVSHYLTRLFPHASISIEIHGDKFDDPNRMFFSLNRTFETASTLKDDIRELIPEFFVLPEMFLNNNNFNLSQDKMDSEGKRIIINEVELPPWANNRNINFVIEMRKNLEKTTLKINKWVDLIFGYLQKGQKAEENHNIFMLNTYENMVNIENIKEDDEKNALMRLVEVGVTPIQILSSESKTRDINQILGKSPYSNTKGAFLWECTDLKCFNINMYKYQKLSQKLIINYNYKDKNKLILPRIIKIKATHKNELRIITNCNFCFNLKFVRNENKYVIDESPLSELINISSKYTSSYQMSNIQIPVVVFGNNKFIIKGGFWDGRIEINSINQDSKEEKDNINFSVIVQEGPVVAMEISKDENLLICGTIYGYLVAYEIIYINNNTNIQLNLIKKLYDHNGSINSISINNTLNMLATCADDENVYLYLLPTFEVFRVFKVSELNKIGNYEDSYEEKLFIANNVFLSNCPLPCVSIYIKSKRVFKSYTVNGEYIGENQETDNTNKIKCSIIFNDLSFSDYLIYGTDDGMIKIRSFPDMNLINKYQAFESNEVECLEISFDKRYCYAWSKGGEITVIKDVSVNDPVEVEQKKFKFK